MTVGFHLEEAMLGWFELKVMILRYFLSHGRGAKPAPQSFPPIHVGHDLYVVGDIHGCDDLLDRLVRCIDEDIALQNSHDAKIVFVGDYIDRGEKSAAVLKTLQSLGLQRPGQIICLKGNHEQMMLDFLDDPIANGRRWLKFGGLQTLGSFGCGGGLTETAGEAGLVAAAEDLRKALAEPALVWLRFLPLSYHTGNVWIVHGGANPSTGMENQSPDHLLWGHPEFLNRHRSDGNWVVHGHTVSDRGEVGLGYISVDTGAYFSGRLTAAAIRATGEVTFLST